MNPLSHLAGTELETLALFALLPMAIALVIAAVTGIDRHRHGHRTGPRFPGVLERRK